MGTSAEASACAFFSACFASRECLQGARPNVPPTPHRHPPPHPPLLSQLDADLLLRLIWLSSWPSPSAPRIPRWCDAYPSLHTLDVSSTAWRPSAGHPAPWPCLRRALASCPGLTTVNATSVRVAGRPAPADGDEAMLLAAAAASHPRLRELRLDVSIRLTLDDSPPPPAPRRLVRDDGGGGGGVRAHPPPLNADAPTPFDALLAGATPLRVACLTVTTPPTCWWYPERPALVARAAALGAAAAAGGTVSRLTLTSLCADEAGAVASTALTSPSVTRLDVVGATGGDAAAGPALAAAIAAATGLTHLHLVDQPLDEGDASALGPALAACGTLTHVSVEGTVTQATAAALRRTVAARAAAGGVALTVTAPPAVMRELVAEE